MPAAVTLALMASLAAASPQPSARVDVYADGNLDAAARQLRAIGMRVDAISRREPQRMIEGRLPVAALAEAARIGAVRPVEGVGVNAGSVVSEGDAVHQGPQARALGPAGAGVVVGFISDTADRVGGGVADSQATGDLPADVRVLADAPAGDDEGRAMAEIVYDTAPGIERMLFHTGVTGAAGKVEAIDRLAAAGADLIVDDTYYLTEPFFQDGVVAQAVDRAEAAGVTYIVSAGNRARQSWEGTYSGGATHDFGGGDTVQALGVQSDFRIAFQWAEPWGEAGTDLAVDVIRLDDGTVLRTIDDDNLASGFPSEFADVDVPPGVDVGLRIRRVAGTGEPFMKYIVDGVPTFAIAEHAVATAGAIDPDASSALGAITVGAVNHAANATPEPFSSRGPAVRRLSPGGTPLVPPEVRAKPDLAGADRVATSVPGFGNFRGTSAAAPSVAGVAALIKSVNPAMTPDALRAALQDTDGTVECAPADALPDADCGYGFPLAAVQLRALDRTPPGVASALSPAAPDGRNGFYTAPVNVSWSVADSGSPIYGATGCAPVTVTADGPITLTCVARSLGGTFTRTVSFDRDGSPPSPPAIAGIEARRYKRGRVPLAVSCSAADPTSGATCAVTGRRTALGRHTLTATATNGAGLTSTAALAYRVVAARVTKVSRRGRALRYTVDAAGPVTITVLRDGKRAKRIRKTARTGRNTARLPKLRPAKYRVKVRPAGGRARTLTFRTPRR